MSASPATDSSAAAVVVTPRRQPLLEATTASSSWTLQDRRFDAKNCGTGGGCSRVGETAGECAAVCCCCPCAMVHLLILAVYRLPRGLWRRKKRKRLLRKKTKKLSEEKDRNQRRTTADEEAAADGENYRRGNDIVVDWEDEVRDRFYWAGFWRSGSQREDDEYCE